MTNHYPMTNHYSMTNHYPMTNHYSMNNHYPMTNHHPITHHRFIYIYYHYARRTLITLVPPGLGHTHEQQVVGANVERTLWNRALFGAERQPIGQRLQRYVH